MFKSNRSHQEFQMFLANFLVKYFSNSFFSGVLLRYASAIIKVFLTDLTPVRKILGKTYNPRGETPWDPVCLFRSYWLMVQYQDNGSITEWVNTLNTEPFWAIISGFHPEKVPGVGTFYDFEDRLCEYDQGERVARTKKLRKPKSKPKKKMKKNQKLPPKHPGIVQKLVNRVIRDEDKPLPARPDDQLQEIFKECFLMPSVEMKLINPDDVAVAGDGTIISTGAQPYGIKKCNCRSKGIFKCDCPRRISDPSATWGWDSHRELYIFGYSNYTFTAANCHYDLPIFSTLAQANRHDSVPCITTLNRMKNLLPELTFTQGILDSAHDNYATYKLFAHWEIEPFIALNERNKGNYKQEPPIAVDENGVPICKAGFKMSFWGPDHNRSRLKWRCPAKVRVNCFCNYKCTDSDYGRTLYTKPQWDHRIFTTTPRGSKTWKNTMKKRSSSERRNSRVKNDFGLEKDQVRSKSRWMIRTIMRDAAIHADVWVKEKIGSPRKWVENILGIAAA